MTPIEEAIAILTAGGVVAIPTETVYGLAADASNPAAVRAVFELKGRPADHPLIVHIRSATELAHWAAEVPAPAAALAAAGWPGPLTLVVRRAAHVIDEVTGGRDTVALRVPAHPVAQDVLHRFGGGLAAPSANRFGRVSPTSAAHVRDEFPGPGGPLVLDGGPCAIGVESTIVDCTTDPPQVLRPGGVPTEDVARVVAAVAPASGQSRAPGMRPSHYAPHCRVETAETAADAHTRVTELRSKGTRADLLDPGDDAVRYAHHLYDWLRRADDDGLAVIVAVLPPDRGLGVAVRDRLRRAVTPPGDPAG